MEGNGEAEACIWNGVVFAGLSLFISRSPPLRLGFFFRFLFKFIAQFSLQKPCHFSPHFQPNLIEISADLIVDASFSVPCPKISPLLAASSHSRTAGSGHCTASFSRSDSKSVITPLQVHVVFGVLFLLPLDLIYIFVARFVCDLCDIGAQILLACMRWIFQIDDHICICCVRCWFICRLYPPISCFLG